MLCGVHDRQVVSTSIF